MWKDRKVTKHCVFPMFPGSGGSKIRLAKAVRSHLVRCKIKNCTPLWRKVIFDVKMLKNLTSKAIFAVELSKKSARLWRKAKKNQVERWRSKHISKPTHHSRDFRRLSRSLTRQDDTRPSPMANKASRISSSVASVSTGL